MPWNYDPARGWLANKRYADNQGPSYTYSPAGRLATRTWARGLTTTYTPNNAGEPASVTYSDSTPAVTLTYDRLGRPLTTTDAAGALTRSYHASGQLQNETYSGSGLLANLAVTRSFDSLDRLSGLSPLPSLPSVEYGYDAASRLQTVTSGTNAATYAYLANSPLVQTLTFASGGTTRLTTTRAYDNLNRLTSVTNAPSAASVQSVVYAYNSANQRTRLTREDGSYWTYGYDPLGQVTSGVKHLPDATAITGRDFGWTFDDIGNRKTATVAARTLNFTPNTLNEYSQRTVPGAVDVFGTAKPDAAVSVTYPAGSANVFAAVRQGDSFYRQMPVDNATSAQYGALTVTGVKNNAGPGGEDAVAEDTRHAFVPQTPESFAYDADGNLTRDGRWTYTWDAENRLVAMETRADVASTLPNLPRQRLEFAYDAQGRRIQKKVSNWNGSAYVLAGDTRFVYGGWNLLAELDGLAGDAVVRTYVWGLDLSGSTEGAGGVGGLLFVAGPALGASPLAPCYDGNGNVVGFVSAADGSLAADFEYDAFGNVLKAFGPAATAQPFGFSTKYTDSETDFVYYGFRYYCPATGRFTNRDPAEESGGLNVYAFVHNAPVGFVDTDGRGEQSANQQAAPPSAPPILAPSGQGSQWRDPTTGQFAKAPSLPPPPPGNRLVPEPETFDPVRPPGNPASAAAAAADLASNLLTASQISVFLNKGRRDCAAQMQPTGGKCACCVIRNYRLTRISVWGNRVYYVYGYATAVNSPCSKIKEDWLNRDEINPYYGNGKSLIQTSVDDFLDW